MGCLPRGCCAVALIIGAQAVASANPMLSHVGDEQGAGWWVVTFLALVLIEWPLLCMVGGLPWSRGLLAALVGNLASCWRLHSAYPFNQLAPGLCCELAVLLLAGLASPRKAYRWVRLLAAFACANGLTFAIPWQVYRHAPKHDRHRCMPQLQQIGEALLTYANDHDGLLPPARSAEDLRATLAPTGVPAKLFHCPTPRSRWALFPRRGSEVNYVLVSALPTRRPDDVSQRILLADDAPRHSGGRYCLFLDGHVSRLSEAAFRRVR